MDLPAYVPETEANKLAEAVVECYDQGMTYDEVDEVVRATFEARGKG